MLGAAAAATITAPGATRDRLTLGMFLPVDETDPIGRLDMALGLAGPAAAIEARRRTGSASASPDHAAHDAGGIITPAETVLLERFERLRRDCIMVDDFAPAAAACTASASEVRDAVDVMAPVLKQVSDRIEETHAR